jgi:hypothetical protein
MTAIRGIWVARAIGAAVGVAAAATLLVASHPAQGGAAVGAEVAAHADMTGELAVSPAGPENFLHARSLQPGESESGSFSVTNQTGQSQTIHARAVAADPKLEHLVSLTFSDGGRLLLGPGQTARITATATLVPAAGSHWQAALIDYAVLVGSKDPG